MGVQRIAAGLIVVIAMSVSACSVVADPAQSPTPTSDLPAASNAPETNVSDINGLYEVTITEDELVDGGVTDPALVTEYAGLYYWSFEDGKWNYDQTSDKPVVNPGGIGDYNLEGSAYTHYWGDSPEEITTATIAILDDGSLQFTDIVDGDPALQAVSEVTFGLHPWVRVGD